MSDNDADEIEKALLAATTPPLNWDPSKGDPLEFLREGTILVDWDEIQKSTRVRVGTEEKPTPQNHTPPRAYGRDRYQTVNDGVLATLGAERYEKYGASGQLKKIRTGSFSCHYPIAEVATLTPWQAVSLLFLQDSDGDQILWADREPEPIKTSLTYPLGHAVDFTVEPFGLLFDNDDVIRPAMDPGYLLWVIALKYVEIYKDPKAHGIWGHGLVDLTFTGAILSRRVEDKALFFHPEIGS